MSRKSVLSMAVFSAASLGVWSILAQQPAPSNPLDAADL
jgi:hypothetical protein